MRYSFKEIVLRLLEKLGSMGADRRLVLTVISVAIALSTKYLGFSGTIEDQTLNAIVDKLIIIVPTIFLLISWGIRPPSGVSREDQITLVLELADEIKEVLELAGLDLDTVLDSIGEAIKTTVQEAKEKGAA